MPADLPAFPSRRGGFCFRTHMSSDNSESVSRTRRRGRRVPRVARTNYFVHLIFYEAKFRWALITILMTFVALVALAPKIWISSPKHMAETVKVSGLDLLQTWNLKRNARRLEAAGNRSGAMSAWIGAVANNPADLEASRGLLTLVASSPKPERGFLGTAIGQSRFLLKLSQTNLSDLALAARVHAAYELYPQVLQVVSGEAASHDPESVEWKLVALFETGRMDDFGSVWASDEARLSKLPVASLYHAAWAAGWGPYQGSQAGRERLEEAAKGGPLRVRALQLLLTLHTSRIDLASYEATLAKLEDTGDVRVNDRVRHWILLDQSGKRDKAVSLARNHTTPAETAAEAEVLIKAWRRLGLSDIAVEFAGKQLGTFGYHPGLWTSLAALLIEAKQWDNLRALAIDVRQGRLREGYTGWSIFLEGLVDHHRNRQEAAAAEFMACTTNSFVDPVLAFSSATTMRRLGYPVASTELLKALQNRFADSAIFWASLQRAAYEARQGDVILDASEQLYQIQPTNAVVANNFAAALLTKRVRSEDALKITSSLISRFPSSAPVRINHATALMRVGRVEEADTSLRALDIPKLPESEQTYANLAWFELHDLRGDKAEARSVGSKVEKRFLFTDQQEWLAAKMAALTN